MDMFQQDGITKLRAALPNLPASDKIFAESLIYQAETRGDLSSKQWHWVGKLAERASQPRPDPVEIGDMAGIKALFDKARQHLKRPTVVLHVADIGEIRISVAGENARVPGSLNVADNAPYGVGKWYGRVLDDGRFEPRGEPPKALVDGLQAFAEEPAQVASEHGKLTGRCCFCNTGLSDPRSTHVGYGKTCASRWGMPWGEKPRAGDLFAEAV